VLVLVGPGHTGSVGLAAAAELHRSDVDVQVVCSHADESPAPNRAAAMAALGGRVSVHAGRLPEAGLVVDALVGRGLRGSLAPPVLDVVLALREVAAPVVAIDLPSGVHPQTGLVGDAVSADVTLALGAPAAGLFASGLAPFVGDLYLVGIEGAEAEAADPIVRVIPGVAADTSGGWRE
jgi:ADP-dependent NAD(P)H-hydrate dehydratase / NAD(P)H-hydrate epimerase